MQKFSPLPYGAVVVVIGVASIMNISAGHLIAAWLGLVAMPLWMIAYEMRSTRLAAEAR